MLLSGCTPSGPRALLEGKRLIDGGQYSQAIQKLKEATRLFGGTNALAWEYLGLAYQHSGAVAEAEWAYQRALALNHDLSEARFNLGCLWLAQNKLEAAKGEFTAYTLRRPNAAEGFLKLGTAQLRAREPSLAEKSFNEALRLNPQNAEAMNGQGLAKLQRGRAARSGAVLRKRSEAAAGLSSCPAEPGDCVAPISERPPVGAAEISRIPGPEARARQRRRPGGNGAAA